MNAKAASFQGGYRQIVQDLYFRCFQEHPFSTLGKLDRRLAGWMIRLNYRKRRPWAEYPILKNRAGRNLIFIHVPKCGGTSVANSLGLPQIRHLPASAFYYTDPERYAECGAFAVLREPVERLGSVLRHFQSSVFSSDRERQIFEGLGMTEENVGEFLLPLVADKMFQRTLFGSTNAGRSGLSVSQTDFLIHDRKLLVQNVFTLDRLDLLQDWLSNQMGNQISIGRSNASSRQKGWVPTAAMEAAVEPYIRADQWLYDEVSKAGGCILENTAEAHQLERVVRETRFPA